MLCSQRVLCISALKRTPLFGLNSVFLCSQNIIFSSIYLSTYHPDFKQFVPYLNKNGPLLTKSLPIPVTTLKDEEVSYLFFALLSNLLREKVTAFTGIRSDSITDEMMDDEIHHQNIMKTCEVE